jgi:hypothetical protein
MTERLNQMVPLQAVLDAEMIRIQARRAKAEHEADREATLYAEFHQNSYINFDTKLPKDG